MIEYSTIEHALDELRAGRLIMCTDDPERENEGSFARRNSPLPRTSISWQPTPKASFACP